MPGWVDQAVATGARINGTANLTAAVPSEGPEPMAMFVLTLSLKTSAKRA